MASKITKKESQLEDHKCQHAVRTKREKKPRHPETVVTTVVVGDWGLLHEDPVREEKSAFVHGEVPVERVSHCQAPPCRRWAIRRRSRFKNLGQTGDGPYVNLPQASKGSKIQDRAGGIEEGAKPGTARLRPSSKVVQLETPP
ncbi:hypothetical protein M9H77_13927 [Catharanthus roseus]|uniref:Uncharacterized protein n=1 Tax=Catharanthus roseus TaxID=4058 RepID=A0ACC0BLR0_CATRO|nr:hypothetical protein M9H77_13927 [Catharanthus roseus]